MSKWLPSARGSRPGSGSAYVFDVNANATGAFLRCPSDIDGDEVADLVLVGRGAGRVQARDVNGALVHQFTLGQAEVISAAIVIPDSNGNGARELVALSGSTVEVRDLLTGGLLGAVEFGAAYGQRYPA
jgi:hypothetical protein